MARQKTPPADESGNVPVWFMTYSDVITLLMTFFILLLTFATSEPETFEQMKVTLFGANGATGFASDRNSPIEKDSVVMRYRPDSSRLTSRGSETAPMYEEPVTNSMDKGLEGLDEAEQYPIAQNYAVKTDLKLMLDSAGRVTPTGRQRMRMLARQLKRGPHDVTFQVATKEQVEQATALATFMSDEWNVDPSRVGVGLYHAEAEDGPMRILLSLGRQRGR